jgi:thiol-disulfide isomerase/thioredoxin
MTARSRLAVILLVALLPTACASESDQRASSPGGTAVESPSPSFATPTTATESTGSDAHVLVQAWTTAVLTDVTTGAMFRIADLVASGKVVFLETMAIWCTNCRAQQEEAVVAFGALDPDRVVWIAIDIESSEPPAALASYREDHGFPFTYVVADADLARALVDDFGDVVLSPPSVNVIVVGTDGRVTQLRGHKSASELRTLAAEHGA